MFSFVITSTISTAQTAYRTKSEWKQYLPKLQALDVRMQDCYERMRRIESIWALKGDWKDEEYRYLLGNDGFEKLQILRQLVETCESVASESLRRYHKTGPGATGSAQHALPSIDLKSLYVRLKHYKTGPGAMGSAQHAPPSIDLKSLYLWLKHSSSAPISVRDRPSFAMRAAFALVTSEELKRRVDSLAMHVEHLETFLRRRFDDLPDVAPEAFKKHEQAKFLEAALALRDRSLFFTDQMKGLIVAAEESGVTCRLIPRMRDPEGHFIRFMDRGDLTVTMSLQPISNLDLDCRRLPQMTVYLGAVAPVTEPLKKLQEHQARGML